MVTLHWCLQHVLEKHILNLGNKKWNYFKYEKLIRMVWWCLQQVPLAVRHGRLWGHSPKIRIWCRSSKNVKSQRKMSVSFLLPGSMGLSLGIWSTELTLCLTGFRFVCFALEATLLDPWFMHGSNDQDLPCGSYKRLDWLGLVSPSLSIPMLQVTSPRLSVTESLALAVQHPGGLTPVHTWSRRQL